MRPGKVTKEHCRTATPMANGGTQRHAANSNRHFLKRPQRSVNRKVQGSSPCPGANFENSRARWLPMGHSTWCSNLQQFGLVASANQRHRSRKHSSQRRALMGGLVTTVTTPPRPSSLSAAVKSAAPATISAYFSTVDNRGSFAAPSRTDSKVVALRKYGPDSEARAQPGGVPKGCLRLAQAPPNGRPRCDRTRMEEKAPGGRYRQSTTDSGGY